MQPSEKAIGQSKIQSIQILRGLAAMAVAIYHLKEFTVPEVPFKGILDFFFMNGAAGVNLFFIISGFIMVHITQRRTYNASGIGSFLFKRFIRIWPTYAVITIIYAFLTFKFRIHWEIKNIIYSLLFIPLNAEPPPHFGYSTLPVGWSLNYEIYFYFIIGICLLFTTYRWIVFSVIMLATLVFVPSLSGHFTLDPDQSNNFVNPYLNMITNPIIWNFVYGIIIGLLFSNHKSNDFLSKLFSNKLLTASVIILACWQYLSGFFGGLGANEWGIGMFFLLLAFIFYTNYHQSVFPNWMVRLGDMSFSLYLLHLPTHLLIKEIFIRLGYPIYAKGMSMFLLSLMMTIIFSSLSYTYLETKFSNYLKRIIK